MDVDLNVPRAAERGLSDEQSRRLIRERYGAAIEALGREEDFPGTVTLGSRKSRSGSRWAGKAEPVGCGSCREVFASVAVFDAHRTLYGEHGSCRDPRTMPGVAQVDGVWFRGLV